MASRVQQRRVGPQDTDARAGGGDARPGSMRLSQNALLDEQVGSLRNVSATRAKALARMGITTVRDLIANYPRRYLDMSQTTLIEDAHIGDEVTVVGVVGEVTVKQPRYRLTIVEASLLDSSGVMFGTWFNQRWMADRLHPGDRVTFSGKVEFNYGFKRMNSPFLDVLVQASEHGGASGGVAAASRAPVGLPAPGSMDELGRIIAIHPLTEGISAGWMRRMVATALEACDAVCDPLPPYLRIRRGLVSRHVAWRDIHFPASMPACVNARTRLAYEELLGLQLYLRLQRSIRSGTGAPTCHVTDGPLVSAASGVLPFSLTDEQRQAVGEILADMAAPMCMNRMLLGDVGTGKTAVALHALLAAVDSGCQAVMMAPTAVLAGQYATKIGPVLDTLGVAWGLLTSATTQAERGRIIGGLADGSIPVAFGTHALLRDDVVFEHLTLVVIDEQHRFGVEQRSALRAKGPASDLLVMTATPIPRTLALTLYGDLECSYLRNRPVARKPTRTKVLKRASVERAWDAIRKEVAAGRQAYVVCPLVSVKVPRDDAEAAADLQARIERGDDVVSAKAAESEAGRLQRDVFPQCHVGLLTGHMRASEKDAVMADFRAGKIDILVSTTVIEVGVDIPNATVMVVQDAERFGLAQLHQLRGRVGRGAHPGRMFLIANARSKEAHARLKALESSDDGFELAEMDLRLRHEGDILGNRQHGLPALKLVDIDRDGGLIAAAHEDAREMLAGDPLLGTVAHAPLRDELQKRFAGAGTLMGGA